MKTESPIILGLGNCYPQNPTILLATASLSILYMQTGRGGYEI